MDIELPRPSATGRDLLVEVRAVSVNPVDYKVRASAAPPAGTAKVIGYDAAGVVVEAGPQASLFRPGDEVFYAGSIIRSGTNASCRIDGAEVLSNCGADFASVDRPCNVVEECMLLGHVGGLEH